DRRRRRAPPASPRLDRHRDRALGGGRPAPLPQLRRRDRDRDRPARASRPAPGDRTGARPRPPAEMGGAHDGPRPAALRRPPDRFAGPHRPPSPASRAAIRPRGARRALPRSRGPRPGPHRPPAPRRLQRRGLVTRIIETISGIQSYVAACRKRGMKVGFVPTMGAFHEGHLTLMREARRNNDAVIVSIFVNPIQFSAGEDYDRYPRRLEQDTKMA